MSAQALSDRCAALGFPIPRSTLANIESGRKRDVPVQEIAVISAGLGVSPVRLMFDVGGEPVEMLPGVVRTQFEALEWFASNWPILTGEGVVQWGSMHDFLYSTPDVMKGWQDQLGPLMHYRRHEQLLESIRPLLDRIDDTELALAQLAAGIEPAAEPMNPYSRADEAGFRGQADLFQRMLDVEVSELHAVRQKIRESGLEPPALIGRYARFDEKGGGTSAP